MSATAAYCACGQSSQLLRYKHKLSCQCCGTFIPVQMSKQLPIVAIEKLFDQDSPISHNKSNSTTTIKALKEKSDFYFADFPAAELYDYLQQEEKVRSTQGPFDEGFGHQKQRRVLVDWVFEMGEKLLQSSLTIHLAIEYLDTIMHSPSFSVETAELSAITCLLLASKFDELDDNIPLIRDFVRLAKAKGFTYEAMQKHEIIMLRALDWDLFKQTPLHFVQNLVGQGVVFSTDKSLGPTSVYDSKVLKSVKKHAEFFADLAIQEYEFKQYSKNVVGVSAIICARRVAKIYPEWNPRGLERLVDMKFEDVQDCYTALYACYEKQILHKSEPGTTSQQFQRKSSLNKENQKASSSTPKAKQTQQVDTLLTMRDTTNNLSTAQNGSLTSKAVESKKQSLSQVFSQCLDLPKKEQSSQGTKKTDVSNNETKLTLNSSTSDPHSPMNYSVNQNKSVSKVVSTQKREDISKSKARNASKEKVHQKGFRKSTSGLPNVTANHQQKPSLSCRSNQQKSILSNNIGSRNSQGQTISSSNCQSSQNLAPPSKHSHKPSQKGKMNTTKVSPDESIEDEEQTVKKERSGKKSFDLSQRHSNAHQKRRIDNSKKHNFVINISSKENSQTRVLPPTSTSVRAKIQRTNSSMLNADVLQLKKHAALKNTTLEEITEHDSNLLSLTNKPKKQQLTVDQVTSNRNFIQRNINYVNKLNEIVKEKKGRTAANSSTRNSCNPEEVHTFNVASSFAGNSQPTLVKSANRKSAQGKQKAEEVKNYLYCSNMEKSQEEMLGISSRRTSDFNCDYLKPTQASLSRARSVAPRKGTNHKLLKQKNAQLFLSNASFDKSPARINEDNIQCRLQNPDHVLSARSIPQVAIPEEESDDERRQPLVGC